MTKKLIIIRNEHGYWTPLEYTSIETHLIAKVLTDLCRDNFVSAWFNDHTSFEYEGNESLLIKRNDKMIFQPLYYEEEPPDTFTCSKKAFVKLIDQWNNARKEKKEFIIIELDEDNNINLYSSNKVPDDYPFKLPPILPLR